MIKKRIHTTVKPHILQRQLKALDKKATENEKITMENLRGNPKKGSLCPHIN